MVDTDSILDSTKKLLGIAPEDTNFDTDVIISINTVLATLTQIGVGPPEGFTIINKNSKWSDLLQDDKRLEFVKSYVYIKVRLIFDPPQSQALLDSLERASKELEFRISIAPDASTSSSEEG